MATSSFSEMFSKVSKGRDPAGHKNALEHDPCRSKRKEADTEGIRGKQIKFPTRICTVKSCAQAVHTAKPISQHMDIEGSFFFLEHYLEMSFCLKPII